MVQLSLSCHRPLQVPQVAQPGLGSVLASLDLQLVSSLFLHTAMAGKRLLTLFLSPPQHNEEQQCWITAGTRQDKLGVLRKANAV